MRLIDADALIEFIENRYEITWDSGTYEGGIKDACSDILEKIDNMENIKPETNSSESPYAYCDNCENNDKDDDSCERCHRKYQNWRASKNVAENVINSLPSAEPDENGIRRKVEDEVWDFARMVRRMSISDWEKCFELYTLAGIFDLNYSEAKAKYDAWRKQKDEIHEYDEIISEVPDNKAVIVRIDCWGQWHCVNSDGIFMVEINQQGYWRKTGRSFPELGDVLKKMRDE